MLDNIRKLLLARPFHPFAVRTADGREFFVPTADHAWISPKGRIFIEDDSGGADIFSALLVASIRTMSGETVG